MSNMHHTAVQMGQILGETLKEDGISQAEFSRQVGVSTKHLNRVINGNATAAPAQLDYWAFALGRRWTVALVPISDAPESSST